MAVFKHLEEKDIKGILANFTIGTLVNYAPIVKGIDNTNYQITTSDGNFILTIFNPRLAEQELPYYMSFMQHLNDRKIPCPDVINNLEGKNISKLDETLNYAITTFMSGAEVTNLENTHIAEAAKTLALMHLASGDFALQKPNAMSLSKCEHLLTSSLSCTNSLESNLDIFLKEEINFLETTIGKYRPLPKGNIHADFFPDNVFFDNDNKVSAVIDFYFSCYNYFVYDLMIAINAWCFNSNGIPDLEKINCFLNEYQKVRHLSDDEKKSLNFFGRVAAMRIVSSRIYDYFFTDKDALINAHNPIQYVRILKSYINKEIIKL